MVGELKKGIITQIEPTIGVDGWPNPMGEKPEDVVGKSIKLDWDGEEFFFTVTSANDYCVYLKSLMEMDARTGRNIHAAMFGNI